MLVVRRTGIYPIAPSLIAFSSEMAETTSAMSKLRKIDDLRGRQRLAEPGLEGSANATHPCVSALSVSHLYLPGAKQEL
jgi:hypothetical protein